MKPRTGALLMEVDFIATRSFQRKQSARSLLAPMARRLVAESCLADLVALLIRLASNE
jgi:hypothetical protein